MSSKIILERFLWFQNEIRKVKYTKSPFRKNRLKSFLSHMENI
ncbi:hypothetical protein ASZ90_008708 [hydrocarbon metagenome]|uniref:Uncharacterized protein n=1 Tax=hydrocarbon metagenome TaxID=938273 RepID=A0A0W8FKW7_9ZZZZ